MEHIFHIIIWNYVLNSTRWACTEEAVGSTAAPTCLLCVPSACLSWRGRIALKLHTSKLHTYKHPRTCRMPACRPLGVAR
eukprot:364260-Chlamydomonas_euryale.AAC.2